MPPRPPLPSPQDARMQPIGSCLKTMGPRQTAHSSEATLKTLNPEPSNVGTQSETEKLRAAARDLQRELLATREGHGGLLVKQVIAFVPPPQ